MMEVIKNLLALQERDRKLMRLREELSRIAPERQALGAAAGEVEEPVLLGNIRAGGAALRASLATSARRVEEPTACR